MKHITKLHCDISEFHHSFLIDLAQIISYFRELTLEYTHFDEYFIENRRTYKKVLM